MTPLASDQQWYHQSSNDVISQLLQFHQLLKTVMPCRCFRPHYQHIGYPVTPSSSSYSCLNAGVSPVRSTTMNALNFGIFIRPPLSARTTCRHLQRGQTSETVLTKHVNLASNNSIIVQYYGVCQKKKNKNTKKKTCTNFDFIFSFLVLSSKQYTTQLSPHTRQQRKLHISDRNSMVQLS